MTVVRSGNCSVSDDLAAERADDAGGEASGRDRTGCRSRAPGRRRCTSSESPTRPRLDAVQRVGIDSCMTAMSRGGVRADQLGGDVRLVAAEAHGEARLASSTTWALVTMWPFVVDDEAGAGGRAAAALALEGELAVAAAGGRRRRRCRRRVVDVGDAGGRCVARRGRRTAGWSRSCVRAPTLSGSAPVTARTATTTPPGRRAVQREGGRDA